MRAHFSAYRVMLLGVRASSFLLDFLYIFGSNVSNFLASLFQPSASDFIFIYHGKEIDFHPYAIYNLLAFYCGYDKQILQWY